MQEIAKLHRTIRRYEDERCSPYLSGSRVMGGRRVAHITPERLLAQQQSSPVAHGDGSPTYMAARSPEAGVVSPIADRQVRANLEETRKKVAQLHRQYKQLTYGARFC